MLTLLAIAAGGCGSSGSSPAASSTSTVRATSTQATGPVTNLRFIARADLICRRVLAQLKQRKLASASLTELARVTPSHVAVENQGLSDLSRLQPPAALAADWQQMLGYMRALASELEVLGRAAKARDASATKKLVASKKRMHTQLQIVAKRAGFSDCQQV